MGGRARTRIAVAVVLVCALGVAGCGSTKGGSSSQPQTTAAGPSTPRSSALEARPGFRPCSIHMTSTQRTAQGCSRRRSGTFRRSSTCRTARATPSRSSIRRTYKVVRHLLGWRASPARRPLLRPEDALGDKRRGQQSDADRPGHRQARQARPGDRSLQHVLHARRPLRDRRRRTAPAPRLPRRALDEAPRTPSAFRARGSTTSTSRPTADTCSRAASSEPS